MHPVKSADFKLREYDSLNSEMDYFPRGVLMEVSINPFTGNVLVKTQQREESRRVLESIFNQMADETRKFDARIVKPEFPNVFSEVA